MDGKSEVVIKWFAERISDGAQLANNDFALKHNLLAEKAFDEVWYTRIDTDVVYNDFLEWVNEKYGADFVRRLDLTKAGFMLIFYRVSGAKRGRTRFGLVRGKTSYVAMFQTKKYHVSHFEQYIRDAA